MDIGNRLLTWFVANARDLPWRAEPRDPYRVLVSELMLQQTQVDRVLPLYIRFIEQFPTLEALAAASEEDVLSAWSGLGYYRRARLLHRLTREITSSSGSLQRSAADLEHLPGIGPYTAAAVASLAFGEAVPVLDGNVMRIAARVLAFARDPRSADGREQLGDWVAQLMLGHPPGQINEALMELGALVCRPRSPDCQACPLASDCLAASNGQQEVYPTPRKQRTVENHRWVAACCIDPDGLWLVKRIDYGPILRGLWLPPWTPVEEGKEIDEFVHGLAPFPVSSPITKLSPVRHSITHRRITVHPAVVRIQPPSPTGPSWTWIDPNNTDLPTSSLLQKLVKAVAAKK
ncbi:MAG: A/G-specific adenine glycosylase [bacterium]|nr:A/G-specific adenine glycosylase [bacterium]